MHPSITQWQQGVSQKMTQKGQNRQKGDNGPHVHQQGEKETDVPPFPFTFLQQRSKTTSKIVSLFPFQGGEGFAENRRSSQENARKLQIGVHPFRSFPLSASPSVQLYVVAYLKVSKVQYFRLLMTKQPPKHLFCCVSVQSETGKGSVTDCLADFLNSHFRGRLSFLNHTKLPWRIHCQNKP